MPSLEKESIEIWLRYGMFFSLTFFFVLFIFQFLAATKLYSKYPKCYIFYKDQLSTQLQVFKIKLSRLEGQEGKKKKK